MKRLAITIVILMLGTLPVAAESVSTQPVRGAELDTMVREMIEWINDNTDYAASGVPDIAFVESVLAVILENYENRGEEIPVLNSTSTDQNIGGHYDSTTKKIFLLSDWSGHTLIDIAGLLHELVHYAQVEANRKFECREDEELEAYILSFDFVNEKFDNQWLHAVPELRAARKRQTTCTPQ